MLDRRTVMRGTLGATLSAAAAGRARAETGPIRVGVLTDMSTWGRDNGGPGAVYAVNQAVKDIGGTVLGRPVEVLTGDHKMLPDLGMSIARQWFDSGVDAVTDLSNSAVALAVSALAESRNRIALNSAAGSSDMTNGKCNNRTVCFTYDTYALAKVVADALTKQGAKTWYFVGADYAFGKQLIADTTTFVNAGGGRVLGTALHPPGTTDFSALLLQAQASKADVIAFANTGTDCTNALKQAQEFGISRGGQKVVTLAMFDTDVAAAGLAVAQNTLMVTSAWGNMSPAARTWTEGYHAATGLVPTMLQLGDYGVVKHWLKAIAAAGTADAGPVMAKMQALPIQDIFCRAGTLRADGRVMREMYLMRVKTPQQATLPYDYLELVSTVKAEDAYRPVKDSACGLVKA
jgi:branched-chain amino acid transport system substrate-binding protein